MNNELLNRLQNCSKDCELLGLALLEIGEQLERLNERLEIVMGHLTDAIYRTHEQD
jgi:hypothetical protein